MRKYLLLLSLLFCMQISFAQLSGTITVGTGKTYATIALAITDLNAQGVGAGGVTFNVDAGHTESTTSDLLITATGTAGNEIIFQKSGGGANPKITRTDGGSNSTSSLSALGDAIIRLNGTDYITFNGIDLYSDQSGIEYGFFTFKNSATDGCQYVTIQNCVIDLTKGTSAYVIGINISNGSTSTSTTTGVTVSSDAGRNKNVTIKGNTIRDCFAGIYVRGGTGSYPDQNLVVGQSGAGNTIENFAGNTASSTYGVYNIYQENPKIDYNTINSAGGGGSTHASTFYGIFFSSGTIGNITADNNTITLGNISSSSSSYGISNGTAVTNQSYSNNTFASGTISSTGTFYLIHASNSSTGTTTVTGNSISGTFTRSATSGTFYFFYNASSPTGTENIYSNTISNITLAGSASFYGIYSNTTASHTHNIYSNTISNITGGTGTMYGIYALAAGTRNIYSNIIHTFSGGGTIYGIYNSSGGATANNTYKNKIYGLSSSSTATTAGLVSGLYFSTLSTNTNIYNNIIGNLTATAATGGDAIRGINFTSATSSTTINLSFNTIYLSGSGGTGFGSSGVYHTYSATATSGSLVMKNNIIVNATTPNGGGKAVAFRRSSATGLTNYSTNSNNNLFYAGTPGTDNLLFYDGTNSDQSLASLKARLTPGESSSIGENPTFVSTTGGDATFLHINTGVATQIESGGTSTTTPTVTDDFDGDGRGGTPDIGADEFTGTAAIAMSYSSSTTTQETGPAYKGVTGQKIIRVNIVTTGSASALTATQFTFNANGTTDINEINVGAAKLYYTGSTATFSTSILFGSTTPTIASYNISGSATLGEGNNYFWLAYDVIAGAVTNNIIDAECTSIEASGTRTPSVTAPSGNKTIVGEMTGTYNVGASQSFPHFTNLTNAITDLNSRGVSGAVIFALQSDYSSSGETFPLSIDQITGASGTNTITIKPAATVTASISGASTSSIIKLNGADYVTIDGSNSGGTDKSLTIENTSTASATTAIWVSSLGSGLGATNNTIKNCNVKAGTISSTSYGIYMAGTSISTSGSGADNNDNTIQNNTITKATYGIYAGGSTTGGDEMNNLTISQNTIGSNTATDYITGYGIRIYSGSIGLSISRNEIFNMINSSSVYGIYFGSTISNSVISRNSIHGFNYNGTSTTSYNIGIYFSSSTSISNNQLDNNIIYDFTHYGPTSTSTIYFAGIRITGGDTYKLFSNTISLTGSYVNTSASLVSNCLAVTTASTNMDIRNNIFYNTKTGTTPINYTIFTVISTTYTAINKNIYYSTGSSLAYVGGTIRTALADIQTATSQDAESLSSDPLLNSATNVQIGLGSPAVSAGDNSTGITVDYAGVSRNDPPTIGAYETAADVAGPSISYTTLSNTNSTSGQTLSSVTITDPSGLHASKPRLYYKKSTNSNDYTDNTNGTDGWKYVESAGTSSPFSFTMDFALLNGAAPTTGTIIQYFVAAADNVGTPNVSINSGTFNATPTTVALPSGAFPITGTINSYSILASISGSINVGSGETYTTLTNAGGLFEAINNSVVTGNITAYITSNISTEAGTHALNEFASPYTVTINPTGGVLRTVSGSVSGALIKLNGADRVTIDGLNTGGNALTIGNTSTSATTAVIWNASLGTGAGATNNSIKNCTLTNGSSSVVNYGISISGTSIGATGADNDDITIQGNTISSCATGIYANGTAIVSSGGLDNLNITNNSVTTSTSVASIGIQVGYALNASISQNTLDIQQSSSNAPVGISLETGFNTSTVTKNKIVRSYYSGTGGYGGRGITIGTGSATSAITLSNNVIYGVGGDNWSSFGGSSSMGIAIGTIGNSTTLTTTTGGVNLYNNSVNMSGDYDRTTACLTAALYVGSGASSLDIRNNVFVNSMNNTNGSGTSSKNYSIYSAVANTAFSTINYNDYYVSGTQGVLGFLTSDRTNLAGIVTGFAGNANSYNANPGFTSATNLLPVANAFPSNYRLGTNISGITTDYSGTTRSNPPDVGAYEGADANRWIGATNTVWSTGTNWDNGSAPASNQSVTIAENSLNNPALGADVTVNGLTIESAATLSIGSNTLTVNGAVSGTGTLTGSSTSNLTVGGTAGSLNFTSGGRTLKDLTLNASSTATLGTALDITGGSSYGTVIINSGATLTTGGNLTLQSNATGTSRIGNSAGSISGDVTVQRYIPSGRRAYRFLGHPFSTTLNMGSLTDDIYVTGTGGAANGFDATTNNNPSAYWFDNTSGGTGSWTAFTHGSTDNSWTQYRGIRALVRGDRTQTGTLDGTNPTPNAVTLDMTGTVNTGNQNISVPTAGAYHLVSNPYPSATDIGTVIDATANIGTQYWMWDANANTKGNWVTRTVGTGVYNLAMNGSFFVQPSSSTTLAFAETNKTATATQSLFQTDNANELLQIQLQYQGRHSDNMFVRFDKDYKNDFDNKDGEKLLGAEVNFYSTTVDGKKLSLDSRPFAKEGIIPITLTSTLQSPFKFVVLENGIEPGIEVYLKDKLLNTLTKLVAGAAYDFEVTADANTQGANRFELVMQKAPEVMAPVTNLNVQVGPNPASHFIKVTMAAPKAEATSLRIVNTDGKAVSSMNFGTVSHLQKDISIQQLPAGTYVVQVTHGDEIITKKIVKQ
jgi:hypothetical protein